MGYFHEASRAGVEVYRIAHVLPGAGKVEKPRVTLATSHVAHRHLLLVVGASRHVGSHVVQMAVVVDVRHVGSHGEPGRVRQHMRSNIAESAVLVVAIQSVCPVEVIGDVEINPAVRVIIPPGRGEPVACRPDSCGLAHIRELRAPCFIVTFVAEKVVELCTGHLLVFTPRHFNQSRILCVAIGKDWLAIRPGGNIELFLQEAGRRFDAIGNEVKIEIAIAIVVGKGCHQACSAEGQATGPGNLAEGAVAKIEIETVGCPEHADEEVQPAISIHVRPGRARTPAIRNGETCLSGGIFEMKVA